MSKRGRDLFDDYMARVFASVMLRQLSFERHVDAIKEMADEEGVAITEITDEAGPLRTAVNHALQDYYRMTGAT